MFLISKKTAKLYLFCHIISEFTPLFHSHCCLNLHISWNTAKSFPLPLLLPTRPQCEAKALILSHLCRSLQRFTATSRPSTHLWLWPCAIFKAIPTSIPSTYSSSSAWNLLPISVFQILHVLGLRSICSFGSLGIPSVLIHASVTFYPSDLVRVIQLMYHFLYL